MLTSFCFFFYYKNNNASYLCCFMWRCHSKGNTHINLLAEPLYMTLYWYTPTRQLYFEYILIAAVKRTRCTRCVHPFATLSNKKPYMQLPVEYRSSNLHQRITTLTIPETFHRSRYRSSECNKNISQSNFKFPKQTHNCAMYTQ